MVFLLGRSDAKVTFYHNDEKVYGALIRNNQIVLPNIQFSPKGNLKFFHWVTCLGNFKKFNHKNVNDVRQVFSYFLTAIMAITIDPSGGNVVYNDSYRDDYLVITSYSNSPIKDTLKNIIPSKPGYKFVRWQLDGKLLNDDDLMPLRNMYIKAYFVEENSLQVNFSIANEATMNGDSEMWILPNTYLYDTLFGIKRPTKLGHIFKAWLLNG